MIELLAPAGNFDTVKPIIDSGVNAIYLGLRDFNARLRAKNFSISELESVIEYCKKKNVKVYVAFNILIKENELKKTIEYLAFLNHIKVDAVIIQDLGILNIINRYFKNLTVHASTQMFLFDQFSLQFAYDNNIKRVILPRELSYTEIKFLNDSSKIELEIFIHGSMCYSISGNCYFSNYIGKLSGNRGMCRQPCRKNFINQPFKNISKIPNSDFIQKNNIELFPYFSLNDLNLLEQIPELLKLDKLKSFKIEGRLKNTEYLLTIINAYKNVIDSYYNNTSQIFESIRHAKESLKNIQARDCSPGYYYYPDIKNIFSSGSPDLYKQAGQIKFVKGNCIYFKSETL